jgi:tetratricopeptide (TPR) repeat protein
MVEPGLERLRSIPGWARAGTLVVLTVPALTIGPALGANRAALEASRAFESKRPAAALVAARLAVDRDAGRADHWNWLGLAFTLDQRWRESGNAFAEAAARAPYDSTYWQNLARSRMLQSLAGDSSGSGPSAAIAAAHRAIEVEPIESSSYQLAAELEYSLGAPDAALRTILLAEQRLGLVIEETAIKASAVATDRIAARNTLLTLVARKDTLGLRLALARIAVSLQDFREAREHARRVLEFDAGNLEAQDILRRSGG